MSDTKNNLNRRSFLNILGASTALPLMQSPVQVLIESIILGAFQSAQAEAGNYKPRRYLHILQEGGPPRWTFDLFLTPYDTSAFVANKSVSTKFIGSSNYTDAQYATVLRKGINVPHLWQMNVPRSTGGVRPMDELLDSLLSLRGITVGNADHGAATGLQYVPLAAGQSMTALSADYAKTSIAAVNVGTSQYQLKSLKSKSAVTIDSNGGNLLNQLLNPFIRKSTTSSFQMKRQNMGAALDAAISVLNSAAENKHLGLASSSSSLTSAKDLLSTGFGNLTTTWNNLVGKYTLLISRALDPSQTIAGINDKAVGDTPASRTAAYGLNSATNILSDPDLRTMISTTTKISRMAEHFAIAEYILINNLSASISLSLGQIFNLVVNGAQTTQSLSFDEHTNGHMISLYLNSFYNLAYSACLLELIDQLKAQNIYNDTVIVAGGEFGRSARNDGLGSDHGQDGSSWSIYSGAITSPLVLGNIYRDKTGAGNYLGTWGESANVTQIGKKLDLGEWASTIAYLLRVPSPVTASSSLIREENGGIIPLIEKARQV